MSKIIDGKALAKEIRDTVEKAVYALKAKNIIPGLATVIVGNNHASRTYINNKIKSSNEVGIKSFHYDIQESIPEKELIDLIEKLNSDGRVDGILVQLPLPTHLNTKKIIDFINPDKDVDGFSLVNAGRVFRGRPGIIPCTPLACLMILKSNKIKLAGKNAIIIGRSDIVGKPMAQLLLKENCTVTITHSYTKNLSTLINNADIIIAAVGSPEMIKKDWIKEGAVVIDVGINRVNKNGKVFLLGDVDFEGVSKKASYITPVPGGVGPMTIACLLVNTVILASKRRNIDLYKGLQYLIK